MEKLTDFERSAICFHVFAGCDDRKTLYRIAIGEEHYNKLNPSSLQPSSSKWYNSHKVQDGIQFYKGIKKAIEQTAIDNYIREQETESGKGAKGRANAQDVNFLSLDEFLQYANDQANAIRDEKEKRAWVEMIGKYMAFKDRNDNESTEIKRYYTPLECSKCEIYNRCKGCQFAECPQML